MSMSQTGDSENVHKIRDLIAILTFILSQILPTTMITTSVDLGDVMYVLKYTKHQGTFGQGKCFEIQNRGLRRYLSIIIIELTMWLAVWPCVNPTDS